MTDYVMNGLERGYKAEERHRIIQLLRTPEVRERVKAAIYKAEGSDVLDIETAEAAAAIEAVIRVIEERGA